MAAACWVFSLLTEPLSIDLLDQFILLFTSLLTGERDSSCSVHTPASLPGLEESCSLLNFFSCLCLSWHWRDIPSSPLSRRCTQSVINLYLPVGVCLIKGSGCSYTKYLSITSLSFLFLLMHVQLATYSTDTAALAWFDLSWSTAEAETMAAAPRCLLHTLDASVTSSVSVDSLWSAGKNYPHFHEHGMINTFSLRAQKCCFCSLIECLLIGGCELWSKEEKTK